MRAVPRHGPALFYDAAMGEGSKTQALADLHGAAMAAKRADEELREAVADAREAGATWREIGDLLGVSKQWAWERFGPDNRERAARGPAVSVPRYVPPSLRRA